MCFELDSLPPIPVLSGGAPVRSEDLTLRAADGNEFAAFAAIPDEPGDAGVVLLPDVRGLYHFYEELSLRFAERGCETVAIDYFGRTAGTSKRDDEFPYMDHVAQTTPEGVQADVAAGVAYLRDRGVRSVFTVGFCMGGRMSFLAATLGLGLAGVIGFYGTLVGQWRNDAPAPVDRTDAVQSPVLGLFGGADQAIAPEAIETFDAGLTTAGVEHRLVTYPGAPHSFFDRKASEFADASAASWGETLAFIEAHTAPG